MADMVAFDELGAIFGETYQITNKIFIRQPTIREIYAVGERRYFGVVGAFTAIPEDAIYPLSKAGIDFTSISDFDFFVSTIGSVDKDASNLLFPSIDFGTFKPRRNDVGVFLYSEKHDIAIDQFLHKRIFDYMCRIHGIEKKRSKPGNAFTKRMMIEQDRLDRIAEANKPHKSQLPSLITSMVCYPGFNYTYETIKDLTYYQFRESIKRAQIYTSSNALLNGAYSGFADMSKVDKNNFNWLRDA